MAFPASKETFTDYVANTTVIGSADLNALRAVVELLEDQALGPAVQNVLAHGADPSGAGDSAPAFVAALAALPSSGGVLIAPPGLYTFTTAGPVLTGADRFVLVSGWGATIQLAANRTAFKIAQGNVASRGSRIEGFVIDGQSNAGTVGVEFEDTNNPQLAHCQILNCATGILFDSAAAGGFVEGALVDSVVMREPGIGIDFQVAAGTGSWGQTTIRSVKCVVGAGGTGFRLGAGTLYRSHVQMSIWIGANETAVFLDGNVDNSQLYFGVEGAAGSTGNVALNAGANATNLHTAELVFNFVGTINSRVSNTSNHEFAYATDGIIYAMGSGAGSTWRYRRHGDAQDRYRLEALTAGGKLWFGPGNAAPDVNLYREGADKLRTDDVLVAQQLEITDGVAAPGNVAGRASLFIDSADGDLKVRFADGVVKTIATDV